MVATLMETLGERAGPQLAAALEALADAVAAQAARLARSAGGPGPEAFAARLAGAGIRWLDRPDAEPAEIDPRGTFALALDPLEGDPGAAAGAPSGTLFTLKPAVAEGAGASLLTPGTAIRAAGAAVYGPRTLLAVALPDDVRIFALDPASGTFRTAGAPLRLPGDAPEVGADTAGLHRWDRPLRLYLEDCLAGAEGPRAADHRLYWTGCLAAETHRILMRGGLLLAPRGAPALPRLIHHAQPLAFLAEAAGGRATDGQNRLLEIVPPGIASTSPLVLGSPQPVGRVATYHDLPDSEFSPLFGQRGLFRF